MAPPRKDKDGFKVCKRCKKRKSLAVYYIQKRTNGRSDVPRPYCTPCHSVMSREENRKKRLEALAHYSLTSPPSCACCSETRYEFLAFDHINNDGAEHRKSGVGRGIVNWMRKNKYPAIFQVLCHNCNMARGMYGACPHTTEVARGA